MRRDGLPAAGPSGPLRVTEIFESIQGESSRQGLPTSFVRLTGCGLRCTWCDTAYAFEGGSLLSADEIVHRVEAAGLEHVCVTGGEPLDQDDCGPLMAALCDRGFRVSLETGGYRDLGVVPEEVMVVMDVKCPGSGMDRKNRWDNLRWLRQGDEVKFVLADAADYGYARDVLRTRPLAAGVVALFSPVHGALDPRELVGWVVRDRLAVRVNLQLHKYVWGPEATGV